MAVSTIRATPPRLPTPQHTPTTAGLTAHQLHVLHLQHVAASQGRMYRATPASEPKSNPILFGGKPGNTGKSPAPTVKTAPTPTLDAHQLHVLHLQHIGASAGPSAVVHPGAGIPSTVQGGSVGGAFSNPLSGDVFGRAGVDLVKVAEYAAVGVALYLGYKYLNRKASR